MGALDGRVAIITGAGRGLGRAHALLFAREGARVVVNDVGSAKDGLGADQRPAQDVVAEICAAGGEAVANTADVTDWTGVEGLVNQAIDTYGGLDVLVNNAGILRDRLVYNMDEEAWDAVMGVHVKGTFATTRFASAYWRDRARRGEPVNAAIINTSSAAGTECTPRQSAYGTAKAAIAAFTLICAKDLARFGIRVNAICPIARTRLTLETAVSKAWAEQDVPEGEFDPLDPGNCASVVAYLATADCPMNGAVLRIGAGELKLYRGWRAEESLAQSHAWSIPELQEVLADWAVVPEGREVVSDGMWPGRSTSEA